MQRERETHWAFVQLKWESMAEPRRARRTDVREGLAVESAG
jgi:hypothetical protein